MVSEDQAQRSRLEKAGPMDLLGIQLHGFRGPELSELSKQSQREPEPSKQDQRISLTLGTSNPKPTRGIYE